MSIQIGLDIGGTKIEIIAIDSKGKTLLRRRVPTPKEDYLVIVTLVKKLVLEVEEELMAKGSVGVGIPGTLSKKTGLVKNSNTQCLNGKPFDEDLSSVLERPVRLCNDANCFALSEAIDGAGKEAEIVFGVIIGTGTGGGIVINKRVVTGCNSISGEWGHNPLPWAHDKENPGPDCYCGRKGCIETFLSGPGMAYDYSKCNENRLSPPQILALANEGDLEGKKCLNRYISRLARGLASIINILDPEVIVLGGGLSKIECLYSEVPKQWGKYVFSDRVNTELKPAIHGDSSGVRGAAWLWPS